MIIKADCSDFSQRHPDLNIQARKSLQPEQTEIGAELTVQLQRRLTATEHMVEPKGFSFPNSAQHKPCGAGKAPTVCTLNTWEVSNKLPRRIRCQSFPFGFVFQSTQKRNQWTYKCADVTSPIVPLGSDTSTARKQLCAGTALSSWHANEQKPMEYLPVLINAWFFFLFCMLYLLFDAFIVSQNNLDVFLLWLLHFFPHLTCSFSVCLFIYTSRCV